MNYRWSGEALQAVIALPAAVVERDLRLAGAAQLKVLLWFARQGTYSAEACAAAIGMSPPDCDDAMRFWVERGVVCAAESAPTASEGDTLSPASETPPETPLDTPSTPVKPTPPPRPQFPQVVARQKESPELDYLLKTAEQRLGRPITHAEAESFLYLFDTVGMPAEVLLMILANALDRGKLRVKSACKTYLERVAIDWADRGITTLAAAEAELCRMEQRDTAREKIKELLSLDKLPTLAQTDLVIRWLYEWKLPDDLILLAAARCTEKTGHIQLTYIHRILEAWQAEGWLTPAAVQAGESRPRAGGKPLPADETAPPEQLEAYEKAAAAWRPVYRKRNKEEST